MVRIRSIVAQLGFQANSLASQGYDMPVHGLRKAHIETQRRMDGYAANPKIDDDDLVDPAHGVYGQPPMGYRFLGGNAVKDNTGKAALYIKSTAEEPKDPSAADDEIEDRDRATRISAPAKSLNLVEGALTAPKKSSKTTDLLINDSDSVIQWLKEIPPPTQQDIAKERIERYALLLDAKQNIDHAYFREPELKASIEKLIELYANGSLNGTETTFICKGVVIRSTRYCLDQRRRSTRSDGKQKNRTILPWFTVARHGNFKLHEHAHRVNQMVSITYENLQIQDYANIS